MHFCPVSIPFQFLGCHKVLIYMSAQGFLDNFVLFQKFQGFLEATGETLDTGLFSLIIGHVINVVIYLVAGIDLVLYAVKTCRQDDCQGKIGVSLGVRAAEFDAGLYSSCRRNSHKSTPVLGRPAYIHRSLIARHQPLVGVYQGIGNGCKAGGMF